MQANTLTTGTQSLNLLQSQCHTPKLPSGDSLPGGLSELTWTTPRHSAGAAAAPQHRGFVKYWWCQAAPTDTQTFKHSSASCYPLLTASARELENRTKYLLSCCSVQLPQQWFKLFLSQRLQVNARAVTSTGLEMLSWCSWLVLASLSFPSFLSPVVLEIQKKSEHKAYCP